MFTHVKCGATHLSVAVARSCEAGDTWTCGWLMEGGWDEDGGKVILECQAAAWATPTGHVCEFGHEHVTAEARYEQGWDYAGDEGEAILLARAGVEPRDMQGRVWMG